MTLVVSLCYYQWLIYGPSFNEVLSSWGEKFCWDHARGWSNESCFFIRFRFLQGRWKLLYGIFLTETACDSPYSGGMVCLEKRYIS